MSRLRLLTVVALAFAMITVIAAPAGAQGNPTERTEVWADRELFGSIVTPATFDPNSDSFDELYGGCDFADDVGAPDLGSVLRFDRVDPAVFGAVDNLLHAVPVHIVQQ